MSDVTNFENGFETRRGDRVEQLDVIPAGSGRRQWTPEAKARIIAESFEPGANVSDVARRHGILPQQLYGWRRTPRDRVEAMSFVPAMVDQALPSQPIKVVTACGEIVIEACGMRIRVPEGVSADHIERVLLAVQVAA
jgi:transposase